MWGGETRGLSALFHGLEAMLTLTTTQIAQLAAEAYLDESQIRAGHQLNSAGERQFHAVDNCECFTGRFVDLSFVTIRGTTNFVDAKANSEFVKVPFVLTQQQHGVEFQGQGKVHRGVLRYTSLVLRSVIRGLEQIGCNKVLVVGHSLGGGCGQVIAAVLSGMGYEVTLVTFGSMRAGNREFATALNKQCARIYRFVNYVDIVPHTPPAFFNYCHTKGLIYFDRSGNDFEHLTMGWKIVDTARGIWMAIRDRNPFAAKRIVADHRMKPYLKLIKKMDHWRTSNRLEPRIDLPVL